MHRGINRRDWRVDGRGSYSPSRGFQASISKWVKITMMRSIFYVFLGYLCVTPLAHAACNNGTMVGTWGYRYTGLDFNLGRFCSGVGAIRFSSANTAQIVGGKVSCDGVLTSASGRGTYSMASNCLGTITFTANTGATLRYEVSVTSGGKEADFILGLDGVTLTGSAKKQ